MKKKKIKNIEITKSPLYGLSCINDLLQILGVLNLEEFKSICNASNYNVYQKIKIVDGKKKIRTVEAPNKNLKKIQKKFNKYLQQILTPEYVNAGRKDMSYIKNAMEHIEGNYMLCTDIKKFFPHTNERYLIDFLKNDLKISDEIISLLVELLIYDKHLPTGAPSSPLLTFWCYRNTFNNIYEFSKSLNIKMTLYVDDMTFSSKAQTSRKLLPLIEIELQKVGLKLHRDKIKRFNKKSFKHVTGVCIDKKHKLRVPNQQREEFINMIKGRDLAALNQQEFKRVIGQIQAMQLIEPKIFQSTLNKLLTIKKLKSYSI